MEEQIVGRGGWIRRQSILEIGEINLEKMFSHSAEILEAEEEEEEEVG